MKLVFFHDAKLKKYKDKYYTSGGLTKNFLQNYLRFFSEILLCTREEEIKNKEETEKLSISSGESIHFNGVKKLNFISLLFGKDRRKIKENISNSDFAIIRMPSFIGIVACKEIKKTKKDYLIEMVGCPWDALWNYGNIFSKLVAPIIFLLNKYYIKKAPNVIYVSNEFLQKRYPNYHNNIGCSDVNVGKIDEKVLEKRLEKIKNKKNNEKYRLGLIGSLDVAYKGHETAIKAISLIKEDVNLELHFLGTGDKRKWVELAQKYNVEEHVVFDGVLPHERVKEWIDEIDIYLIPSLQEGLPRALVETMSRGCPAIGSNVGGITELISKEYIINKKDFRELARNIKKFIDNKKEMEKSAKENFNKSLEFNLEDLKEKKEKFYKDILKQEEEVLK